MNSTQRVFAPLVGVALLVVLMAGASFWSFMQTKASAEARKHAYTVIGSADALLSDLKDAETNQRGYSLTGDQFFLAPYVAVREKITGDLKALRSLTAISAAQEHLDAIAPLLDAKLAEMSRVIELRRRNDIAAASAAVAGGQGRRLMDSIRTEMSGFSQIENLALEAHDADLQSDMRNLLAVTISTSLLMLALALSFSYLFYRESKHRLKSLVHLETQHLLEIQEQMNNQLRQTNATLGVSEEKLAVTLRSIGDGVIATDGQGRVVLLNSVAERLTGWSQAQAANRPVDEIFHIISQETRLPSAIPVKETLARGTVQGLANHTVLIARDGSECAIADCCAPIRDRDGQMVGAVLVFRDVTGEYAAGQALRDLQFYTRSLIESNVDAIMTTDPSGIITDVNAQMETLTGCTRDELIGAPFKNHFTDPERAEASIALVLAEKKVSDYELTARARNGKETTVSYNASTFYNRDRKLQGVFAAARDITERERLYQMLQERNAELESTKSIAEKANLAKSNFLSSMSHELRTPLNAILGFAQILESGSPLPSPAQKRSIDQILKAGWYLLELINEILDLALIESGRVTLSREPVSLAEVMSECRAMIEPQATKRGIEMRFPQFDANYFVSADRTRVKQVLVNLLFNAIKYNRTGGKVTVECAIAPPDAIRVTVRDTGAGLDPQQLTQLFQPFNRLGKEAGGEEGTGIGLVVCKRLMDLMGGTIGAESTVGTGSVFWIELSRIAAPFIADAAAAPAVPAEQPAAPAGTSQRTLLYVEDNPANLELVEELIKRRPELHLLSAADGHLGIEFARAYLPEVILMDIHLPGISGIEAMHVLRADPSTAHIPIIALSANAVPHDIEHALEAGFFSYLTKPIKVTQFMEALDLALESAKTAASMKSDQAANKDQT